MPAKSKPSAHDNARVQGLRVVDASIMPHMPSTNTYGSTMMIAEKAADRIRGRAASDPVAGIAA